MSKLRVPAHLAVPLVGFALLLGPSRSEAVTVRDIVELARAGLSDEILLAVLEADPTIFSLDTEQILQLKEEGLSDRVIVAMLGSGRTPEARDQTAPAPQAPLAPAPQPTGLSSPVLVVIERERVVEAPQPYWARPLFVPVPIWGVPAHRGPDRAASGRSAIGPGFGRFINDGYIPAPAVQEPAEPVYWGYGGKLRPGAWDPER